MADPPRDLNGELIRWVRGAMREPAHHILAALMGNAVNLARSLDLTLDGFIAGIEAHWQMYSDAAAKAQAQPSDVPSVGDLLRAVTGKGR